jgi:uncharacterized cupredoxin-like copper-binding protein
MSNEKKNQLISQCQMIKIKKKIKKDLKKTELKPGKSLKLVNRVMRMRRPCKRQK